MTRIDLGRFENMTLQFGELPRREVKRRIAHLAETGGEIGAVILRDFDFSGMDFHGARFNAERGGEMENVCFDDCDLTNVVFTGFRMMHVTFRNANLTGTRLDFVKGRWLDFACATLNETSFERSVITNSYFKGVKIISCNNRHFRATFPCPPELWNPYRKFLIWQAGHEKIEYVGTARGARRHGTSLFKNSEYYLYDCEYKTLFKRVNCKYKGDHPRFKKIDPDQESDK